MDCFRAEPVNPKLIRLMITQAPALVRATEAPGTIRAALSNSASTTEAFEQRLHSILPRRRLYHRGNALVILVQSPLILKPSLYKSSLIPS
ncbi:hypothetical protein PAAG_07810 [Paracoccidioides lutzii Pb01]|uniref:Uncharacterized protein n=1 Tax=Paracoccidioides lutzii (strain ATCC MYA-826 / Pb01) TaxID=502779 RepID=C1HA81_PARBA|nr:hypothetical protein PAAG_07810 [Paracoccidioides lutzii Pb01]EEH37254.2 hypothetical protein PAAG_07810 [Paracoccidioides lutzii Pb01]